ncbi:MAG: hypothetical protein ABSB76_15415 [Streptosporangiaceae bacterium]
MRSPPRRTDRIEAALRVTMIMLALVAVPLTAVAVAAGPITFRPGR